MNPSPVMTAMTTEEATAFRVRMGSPWGEGWETAARRFPVKLCLYPVPSEEWRDWFRGYEAYEPLIPGGPSK